MFHTLCRTRKHEKEQKRRESSFRLQAGQRASHIYEYIDDFEDNAAADNQRSGHDTQSQHFWNM